MNEAIYGLIGVIVGAAIPSFQTYWISKQTKEKNAQYLAIRLVCILDKFMEGCADVVNDDGLSFGQRTHEGLLEPQVKAPGAPVYPEDVDWKSIDHDLMYNILSLPSEVETGDRVISATTAFANPPDYEEWFDERRFWYSKYGLVAFGLSEKLSKRYNIRPKTYNDWNPKDELLSAFDKASQRRQNRIMRAQNFAKKTWGDK